MRGVSIIIPTHECWPLLKRTLISAAHDARALGVAWEIIVVDNESHPSLVAKARHVDATHVRTCRRIGLRGRHFRPGSARNLGIGLAMYDCLVFLDSDCVPAPGTLRSYWRGLQDEPERVLLSHRLFIDAGDIDAQAAALNRSLLNDAPRVPSASNYGLIEDRRLPELLALARHPRPYDCLFSCNFAIHRLALDGLRFDPAYDGHWGYEDIDLGYRLYMRGRGFSYLPEAHVYHQEGTLLTARDRWNGRRRNFSVIAAKVPGFARYRARSSRAHPVTADGLARAA